LRFDPDRLARRVVSNDGSFVLMWAGMLASIAAGTFGLDRWYERNHPRPPR
jgi:hypothetical protein